jgi:lambda family phage tail tape measure protein
MAVIGSLSVKLGLVTVEWDKATADAKQKAVALKASMDKLGSGVSELNGLWKQMGGSLAIGSVGMAALIAQTAAFADRIQDLADGLGISTGFALQFNDALMKAGSSGEAATKILGKLFDNIDKAREGNQENVDQFRALGISFSEIKELKPEDAIRRVVASLAELQEKDTIKYVAELRKQLGKGGLGLDMGEVNAIIQGGVGAFEKYGEGIKQVSKVKDQLTASMNNLMIAFAKMIGPFAHEGTVSVEKFTGALAGLATYFVASKVIAFSVAITELVVAMRAATAAGAAFNIMASGSPLMLALKLAAMGTAFVIYQKETGSGPFKAPPATYNDKEVGDPTAMPTAAELDKFKNDKTKADEYTVAERAAAIGLQTERIKTLNTEAKNGIAYVDTFLKSIVDVGTASGDQLEQLKTKRAELQKQYKDNPTLLGLELGKLKEQEKQIISNTRYTIGKLQYEKQLADLTQEQNRQEGYRTGLVKMSEDEAKLRLESAKVALSIQEREIDNQSELNKLRLDGSATLVGVAKTMVMESLETQRSLDKLKAQLESLPEYIDMPEEMLSKEAKANNDRIDAIKAQMSFEQDRHNLKMANLQNEQSFEFGFTNAMATYIDNTNNLAKQGSDAFNSMTTNMNSALDNFVKTGKLSFKSLARSIIQDLIAIQLKASANSIFKSLFGGGFMNDKGGMELNGSLGFADGGSPPVGQVSIVGERGPELFVPSGSGTIIPNGAMQSMGGTTNVTNNYINAIDTKSFEERLYGSSNAIWAANQYANKSLAVNRGRA